MIRACAPAEAILRAGRTNNRVTVFLFQNLPRALWSQSVPGSLVARSG